MPMSLRFLSALVACLLASCATSPSSGPDSNPARATRPAATHPPDSVLLVSLDGFRADYLDLGITPNLSRIARQGVRARWMTPSYPTLTFPNHYSMVTGLVPDHHGIVHNTMRDAAIGGFKLADRKAVGDGRWWGGEPIWVSAEKAGLPSATLYWPGSEAEISGVRPTRWSQYREGHTRPLDARVDTVLGWLSEPEATRPRIATLYFETVDHDSHADGPDSPQAHAAVRAVDAAIGRLLDGLVARGIAEHVNLVVVSDHGMATVPRSQLMAVEDVVAKEEATVVTIGQVITIAPNPGHEARVERKLLGKHDGYDCWRKGELPARWRYGSHPRIPPIVCQMHEGWDMLPRETIAKRTAMTRGSHGYDPALPSMRALFVASGPAFRRGVTLQPFANVDVYPLLARLLGIRPAPHDGDIAPLLPALRDAPGSM
jgi:predicted AlkP superfamily pyrophosphatase or phosphodiesterase